MKYLALILSLLLITACATKESVLQQEEPPQQEEDMEPEMDFEDPMAWVGTYEGVLPCDDCEGIQTTLKLTETENYILEQKYLGTDREPVVHDWVFIRTMNWDFILLLDRDQEIIQDIEIGDGVLYVLNDQRERYEGENADRYILRKAEQ